jgi:hypothetical protein
MHNHVTIAAEMAGLMNDVPGVGATPATSAAWTRRKAALLRRIAEETDDPAERADATVLAALAEQSATRIESGE